MQQLNSLLPCCNKCGLAFAQNKRSPRVMPCGHSICSICNYREVKSASTVKCPECFQEYEPEQARIFPENLLYLQLCKVIKQYVSQLKLPCKAQQEKKLQKCLFSECKKQRIASKAFCSDKCEQYFYFFDHLY